MTNEEAAHVLEMLAQGLDPQTGTAVAAGGVLSAPIVIRALFVAARHLRAAVQPLKASKMIPDGSEPKDPALARQGKAWGPQETESLLKAFDAGVPVVELARRHRRTSSGIAARLVKIGRIKERDDAYLPNRSAPAPKAQSAPAHAPATTQLPLALTPIPPLGQRGELVKATLGVDTGRSAHLWSHTPEISESDRPSAL